MAAAEHEGAGAVERVGHGDGLAPGAATQDGQAREDRAEDRQREEAAATADRPGKHGVSRRPDDRFPGAMAAQERQPEETAGADQRNGGQGRWHRQRDRGRPERDGDARQVGREPAGHLDDGHDHHGRRHQHQAVQPARRGGVEMGRREGEDRERDGGGYREPEPGRDSAGHARSHGADGNPQLAARRPGQELAQGHQIRVGRVIEPRPPAHVLLAKVAEMRHRTAERGEAETPGHEEDLHHRATAARARFDAGSCHAAQSGRADGRLRGGHSDDPKFHLYGWRPCCHNRADGFGFDSQRVPWLTSARRRAGGQTDCGTMPPWEGYVIRRLGIVVAGTALLLGQLLVVATASAASGGGTFTAKLNGLHEVPSVATAGTGSANVIIAPDGKSLYVQVSWTHLSSPAVAAHIHLGAIGANGPIIFPFKIGPSPLTTTLTAADFTGAGGLTFDQAVDAIRTGGTYVNVHTAAHPGGEIRGQLTDQSVAASYTITADAPQASPAGHFWEFADYFPRTLTVAQGSTISFNIEGFHTATLLPTGMSAAQDIAANGIAAPDPDDTTPNINGSSHSVLNLQNVGTQLPTATCGTTVKPCYFTGNEIVQQGAPLGPPETPATIYVAAPPGTYVIHCRIHPAMTGALTVVPPGDPSVASADDVAATNTNQLAAAVSTAAKLEAAASKPAYTTNADGTRTWWAHVGVESADGHVDLLEMLPAKLTIKAGDKVAWLPSGLNEVHTVTFPEYLGTDSAPLCEGPNGTDTPAVPIVIPPMSLADLGCNGGPLDELENGGGNGVSHVTSKATQSDSGLVATVAGTTAFGLPTNGTIHSWTVSFKGAAKTTYTYVCQIHDGMAGIVVVK